MDIFKENKKPVTVNMHYAFRNGAASTGYSINLVTEVNGKLHSRTESGKFNLVEPYTANPKILLKAIDELNLKEGRPIRLIVHTNDAIFSANINKNMQKWSENDWKTLGEGRAIKNGDLYRSIHEQLSPNKLFIHTAYSSKDKKQTDNALVEKRIRLQYFASLECDTISVELLQEAVRRNIV